MKRTLEKEMTLNQQLGMVTVKGVVKLFVDNGVDFQIATQESFTTIVKEFMRFDTLDLVDAEGNTLLEAVTRIVFRLHQKGETKVVFYNLYNDVYSTDRYRALEIIAETYTRV